jgi:ABC-type nickel/cobalt efflux system permease component RcnA
MRRSVRRAILLGGVVAVVLSAPSTATAHPLGNFTVNRYAGIELTPGEVRIDYVVDLAEIPSVQLRPEIDADADGALTDAERAGWAARTAPDLAAGLTLTVDGAEVPLEVVSASLRVRPGQGGLDILRMEATFAGPLASEGELMFADTNFGDRIGWREVTAAGADGTVVADSTVPESSVSNALLSYPQDLLASPLDVHRATVTFRPGVAAPMAGGSDRAEPTSSRPDVTGGAFVGLVGRTGPFMLVALLLAFGFGALHALGPGHGKTLMAAYLVGAGGRARHAVAVGGSVAVMHTASVLALGFVVLTVTEVFAPERVYPWLGLVSGLIAFALGAGLLVSRLGGWSERDPAHVHDHPHREGAPADATEAGHAQPIAHGHHHASPSPFEPISRKSLTALAVAGGMLPSPTALVVLLAAVAVDRVAYGLALIGAFSLGLATALVAVGILALRARDAVAGRMSSRTARLVPVLSAASIALLGLALTLRGFTQL